VETNGVAAMFGSLLGHLNKAKNRIESEIGPIKDEEGAARRRPLQPRLSAAATTATKPPAATTTAAKPPAATTTAVTKPRISAATAASSALKRHLGSAVRLPSRRADGGAAVDAEAEPAEPSQQQRLKRPRLLKQALVRQPDAKQEPAGHIGRAEEPAATSAAAKPPRVQIVAALKAAGVVARKKTGKTTGTATKRAPRSNNLFSKMVGHLQAAKKTLDTDEGPKRRIKPVRATLRAPARAKPRARVVARQATPSPSPQREPVKVSLRPKRVTTTKAPEVEKSNGKASEKKELAQLRKNLETHYSCMTNFIRTKAEPTIFYLPVKHTPDTESKLEETRGALRHKISSLKAQLRVADDGSNSDEASSSAEEEDAEEGWMASFPESALQQAVLKGLGAQSAWVTSVSDEKALVVEYEGGSYGQGRHSGHVELSEEDLRIHDRRYPGKFLKYLNDRPVDPQGLTKCLQSPNWDFAKNDKR